MKKNSWLEKLDHTADDGFIIKAPDLPTLFARAATGMFSILTDLEKVDEVKTDLFDIEASDRESLLVNWLSELNFQHVVKHRLYCRFVIVTLDDLRLTAKASGDDYDPKRHVLHTEIKAVTYHGLYVRQAKDEWRSQIIFDL